MSFSEGPKLIPQLSKFDLLVSAKLKTVSGNVLLVKLYSSFQERQIVVIRPFNARENTDVKLKKL